MYYVSRSLLLKGINNTFTEIITLESSIFMQKLELVSKELNHLAAILHVYAGGLIFMK